MLMTGKEYLDSIRDGRRVYVGGELVEDVTAHPAFRNAARSFAMIYDRKRNPENRDLMTFEEDGETFSTYFLLPRTREDLQRRFETHSLAKIGQRFVFLTSITNEVELSCRAVTYSLKAYRKKFSRLTNFFYPTNHPAKQLSH
jgi:aromatic ring hydroxylase